MIFIFYLIFTLSMIAARTYFSFLAPENSSLNYKINFLTLKIKKKNLCAYFLLLFLLPRKIAI